MPLGWERINVRKTSPNKNIVFIKPRPGPDEAISKDYLERIAAQCLPIMNKHHLAVVSLEEYEPNLEFWGRNFNNGEVIQLVLKSPSTGQWLPFKFVQMVMMHELAHNKQMNHSKAFWKVRNEFSDEVRVLWDRGYTGDGLWGRGVLLENGAFAREELGEGEVLPEHMCGGTFRSRGGRKRKIKPKITYKEAKERRIKKKFGENGMALGADDNVKAKLENGKRPAGKPRVAGSARGRELRAAAALARFEVKKEEPQVKDEDLVTDSDAESDMEDEVSIKTEPDDAVDIDGKRLLDIKGQGMVKVCEDEDQDDDDVRRELQDLQGIHSHAKPPGSLTIICNPKSAMASAPSQPSRAYKALQPAKPGSSRENSKEPVVLYERDVSTVSEDGSRAPAAKKPPAHAHTIKASPIRSLPEKATSEPCPICSVENDATALTCLVCANVLKPNFVPNSWRCKSATCNDGNYYNAGDVGLCGVCGTRKFSDGT